MMIIKMGMIGDNKIGWRWWWWVTEVTMIINKAVPDLSAGDCQAALQIPNTRCMYTFI